MRNICVLVVKQMNAWTAPIPAKLVFMHDDWGDGKLDGLINASLKS